MLLFARIASAASLIASVSAAVSSIVRFTPQGQEGDGISYSVNVPLTTAQSGSGSIYIQMVAPPGTRWLGLGQGDSMTDSNMFLIYGSANNNITLSPRLGKGDFEPELYDEAEVTLLEGSELSPDGAMIANIRCDSCMTWDGGSMDPTSGKSNWIWAVKQGTALESNDLSAGLNEHDAYGEFTFDLTMATSSDAPNPFLQVANVTDSEGSDAHSERILESHGLVMAVVFLFLFPLGALTIYLPFSRKVLFVHAPLQILSICLLIAGAALGLVHGVATGEYDGYHQAIGYTILGCILLFQPALGLLQHLRHRKVGKRTIFGLVHRWFGRVLVLAGIINGGLGLYVSGDKAPKWAVIVYSTAAAVIGIFYITFAALVGHFRKRKAAGKRHAKY